MDYWNHHEPSSGIRFWIWVSLVGGVAALLILPRSLGPILVLLILIVTSRLLYMCSAESERWEQEARYIKQDYDLLAQRLKDLERAGNSETSF